MGIENLEVLNEDNPENHDEEDVKAALERETSDGSGFDSEDELPESDFDEEDDE